VAVRLLDAAGEKSLLVLCRFLHILQGLRMLRC
jgi:hypothetical protein